MTRAFLRRRSEFISAQACKGRSPVEIPKDLVETLPVDRELLGTVLTHACSQMTVRFIADPLISGVETLHDPSSVAENDASGVLCGLLRSV